MKYWILFAAPLFGCAAVDEDVDIGPQIVDASGVDATMCKVILGDQSKPVSAKAFAALDPDRPVRVKAGPDTAYECVTDTIDQLNDLRMDARIDEASWNSLASVKRGKEKLAADIAGESGHPEARPFVKERTAQADLDEAFEKAAKSGNNVLLVMGANWCHDSRALSGWFASPHFKRMVADQYELAFVDVGYRDRNIDIPQRFGIKEIEGTPTVLVVSPEAQLLNPETAPTWRNAASRSEEEIFNYFSKFEPEI